MVAQFGRGMGVPVLVCGVDTSLKCGARPPFFIRFISNRTSRSNIFQGGAAWTGGNGVGNGGADRNGRNGGSGRNVYMACAWFVRII